MASYLTLPRAPNCEARSLVGQRDGLTIIVPLRCGSWSCVRCAARKSAIWANRVAEAEPERMVTFTKLGAGRDEIRLILQQIVRDLRKAKYVFEYWGVIELHRSGHPHIHVLQKGSFIPQPVLQAICYKYGWGFSDIRRTSSGFSAAAYCGKHLCHSHGRRWPGRLIRFSKKFFTKDVAQGDLKEASREEMWTVVWGRADGIAAKYQERGQAVELGELGDDWIMGEMRTEDDIYRRYSRGENKGYTKDAKNFDPEMHVGDDARFTNPRIMEIKREIKNRKEVITDE